MDAHELHTEAWEGIRRGYEAGRLAHAYVIVGAPRGNALRFAEFFLQLLFCEREERPCGNCTACRLVKSHAQVDTFWVEPQSKSRQILADDIRRLIQRIGQTSFGGGWKAGVVISADRMNTSSANALLKTLEEPPAKSILLLITDSPQSLLPTIISRCQKIVLSAGDGEGASNEVWRGALVALLQEFPPSSGLDAAQMASRLKGVFDGLKEEISDVVMQEMGNAAEGLDESKVKEILSARTSARLKEVQADVFRVMLEWQRDLLLLTHGLGSEHLVHSAHAATLQEQAKLYTPGSALRAMQTMEAMIQRANRNLPELQVFDEAFRRLVC